eukprot:Skav213912  [mRNA]  locus=scaffold1439:226162:226783:+ [translate_table: standard]
MPNAWLHFPTAPAASARNENGDLAPADSYTRPPPVEVGSLPKQLHGSTTSYDLLLQLFVQLLVAETTATLSAKRSGALYPLGQPPISRRDDVSANAIERALKSLQAPLRRFEVPKGVPKIQDAPGF